MAQTRCSSFEPQLFHIRAANIQDSLYFVIGLKEMSLLTDFTPHAPGWVNVLKWRLELGEKVDLVLERVVQRRTGVGYRAWCFKNLRGNSHLNQAESYLLLTGSNSFTFYEWPKRNFFLKSRFECILKLGVMRRNGWADLQSHWKWWKCLTDFSEERYLDLGFERVKSG